MRTCLWVLSVGVFAGIHVHGYERFLDEFPNGALYKQEDMALAKAIGHCEETGTKTPFALLLKENNCEWAKVCPMTFPGHRTMTVGEAFGDPCCTWEIGGTPDYILELSSFQKGKPKGTRHKCKKDAEPTPSAYDEPDTYKEPETQEPDEYNKKTEEPNEDEYKKTEPVTTSTYVAEPDENEYKKTEPVTTSTYGAKPDENEYKKTEPVSTDTYNAEPEEYKDSDIESKKILADDKPMNEEEVKDDIMDLQSVYKAMGIVLKHLIDHTGVKLPDVYPIEPKTGPPPVNPGPNGFGKQPIIQTDKVVSEDDETGKKDNYGAPKDDYRVRMLRNRLV